MKIIHHTRTFVAKAALATSLLLVGVTTPAQAASTYSTAEVPALTTGLHPVEHLSGDRDLYSCWGKNIYYTVGMHTFLSVDKKRLMMDVYYHSYENGGDRSQFKSVKTYAIYTAPEGHIIEDYPHVEVIRTQARYGYHAGSSFYMSWFGLDDVRVMVHGDQHGTDEYQGYVLDFGSSWTVKLKRVGHTIPYWNRFWR